MITSLFRKKSLSQISLQAQQNEMSSNANGLKKKLTARDLTIFGITAIIGSGAFSTIGNACVEAGPSVILLFIFTAVACGLAAFAYAEFASIVPVSGSSYTYSYVAFGEIIAWIIGWGLIMEYAVGNTTVAVSWSDYFTGLMDSLRIDWLGIKNGIHIPEWASIDYVSAKNGFKEVSKLVSEGKNFSDLPLPLQTAWKAWYFSPGSGNFKFIADIPAIAIVILITRLVYRGIEETRKASLIMVIMKMTVLAIVICVGVFQIDIKNFDPFMPNGVGGILKGVSGVFFAYIGFDAIANTAEECRNPEKDLPKGILWSIIICTIIYVMISLVLTGMVKYNLLKGGDPLFFVFKNIFPWIAKIIAVGAIVAIAGVLLVFQMGQPRIWMSMSRDGLLPKKFSKIHPKFGSPSYATIVTGIVVCSSILIIPSEVVMNLSSMGTLFAFVIVCAGVLKLNHDPTVPKGKFRTPFISARFVLPILSIGTCILIYMHAYDSLKATFSPLTFNVFVHELPMYIFILLCLLMNVLSIWKNLSLIPVLGLLFCFYMMVTIPVLNWFGFFIWLMLGMIIYFLYGRKRSLLVTKS